MKGIKKMQKDKINILVACEESQAITKAFRKLGFNAFSCDLQKCSGSAPQWHINCDCKRVIETGKFTTQDGKENNVNKWTLIIAHPPCTYLSNAGACHLWRGHVLNKERYSKGLDGKNFFMYFYNLENVKHLCIENPIPSKIYNLPKQSQVIQPYEFGHPYSKKRIYGCAICHYYSQRILLLNIYLLCLAAATGKRKKKNIKAVAGKAAAARQEAKLLAELLPPWLSNGEIIY